MKKASLTVFKEKSALHESTEFESDSESDEQNEFDDKYSNGDTATFSMFRDTIKGLDCYMSPRIKSTVNNAEKDKDTLMCSNKLRHIPPKNIGEFRVTPNNNECGSESGGFAIFLDKDSVQRKESGELKKNCEKETVQRTEIDVFKISCEKKMIKGKKGVD